MKRYSIYKILWGSEERLITATPGCPIQTRRWLWRSWARFQGYATTPPGPEVKRIWTWQDLMEAHTERVV